MLRTMLRHRAFGMLLVLTACGTDDILGPPEGGDPFVEQLSLTGFEEALLGGTAQVEVALMAGGLTASELVVRVEERSPEERVQSRVIAVDATPGSESLTIALGHHEIAFDGDTRFWIAGEELTRGDFLEELQGAVAEGHEPPVVAERLTSDLAQDPDDATFVADGVALTGEGAPSIRLDVDADNVEVVPSPQGDEPDAWLTLLGLRVQLRVRDGTTKIESHHHDFEKLEEFEGLVASVDVAAGSFTLESGVVVRVLDRTEISDGEGLLASLGAVAEALAGEHDVLAWGRGGVEGVEPLRLAALKVAFKVRTEDEPAAAEFEGEAVAVDVPAGELTLGDGTVVVVSEATEVVAHTDHSPHTLAGVAEALEAGRRVLAWGHGEPAAEEPHRIAAARLVLKTPIEDFEQLVASVDLDAGTFTLEGGWVVTVTDETEVFAADDGGPASLEEAADALSSGASVRAWGWGYVVGIEPVRLEGRKVTFRHVED